MWIIKQNTQAQKIVDVTYAWSTFIWISMSFGEIFCLPKKKFALFIIMEQARNALCFQVFSTLLENKAFQLRLVTLAIKSMLGGWMNSPHLLMWRFLLFLSEWGSHKLEGYWNSLGRLLSRQRIKQVCSSVCFKRTFSFDREHWTLLLSKLPDSNLQLLTHHVI